MRPSLGSLKSFSAIAGISALLIAASPAWSAVDASVPVDVPDEIGLGERLALVAWLRERHVTIADAQDLPALRLAYLRRAHPERFADGDPAAQARAGERGDLAAELYRKHGINPPTDADAAAIRALLARLDAKREAPQGPDQAPGPVAPPAGRPPAAGVATIQPPAAAQELQITGASGDTYVLTVPATVVAVMNSPPPGIPPTIKIRARDGQMSLQITVMPKTPADLSVPAQARAVVRQIGKEQYERGSVEQQTTLMEFPSGVGLCVLAPYTDAELVAVKQLRPGQFRLVTTGIITLGKDTAMVTLLGNEVDGAAYQSGLALLRNGFSRK